MVKRNKIKELEKYLNISQNIWRTFGRTEQLEKQSSKTYVRERWKYKTYWRMNKQPWSASTKKWCTDRRYSKQNKRTGRKIKWRKKNRRTSDWGRESSIKIWWRKLTWNHEGWTSTNIWTKDWRKQCQVI